MATTTALVPIDPAASRQQVNRVLPIRANLLPPEITADRNARRIRFGLLGAILFVVILVVVWYVYALRTKSEAEDNRRAVAEQIQSGQRDKQSHQDVTTALQQKEAITKSLSALLTDDLPWATTLDKVRAASPAGLQITSIVGRLNEDTNIFTVGTLTIKGQALDKKTIARYIDTLRKMKDITNPYLTTASRGEAGLFDFEMTSGITSEALCGQFTQSCKTGGK